MYLIVSDKVKKNFLLFILAILVFNTISFSQWGTDTLYFDKNWKNTDRNNASYYRLMDADTINILFLVKDYYLSGQLQMEGAFRSINPDVQVGDFNYWYENGQLQIKCFFNNGIIEGVYREWHSNGKQKTEKNYKNGFIEGLEQDWDENGILTKSIEYKNGIKNGRFITYYNNGQPIRKDTYVNGELKKGKCYTYHGKDTSYFEYFIMPKFKGGIEGFKNYILEKLNYPDAARQNDEEGQVYVRFTIDTNGSVKGIRLIKEDKEYFNEEAVRVVSDSPKWIPGKRDGKLVDVSITMPILFKLE